MLNFRPILYINGILLSILAAAMLIPAIANVFTHSHSIDWRTFCISAFLTAFFGISLILTNRGAIQHFNIRQAFMLTTTAWVLMSIFATLPFVFSNIQASFTDAFFESMSGLTTTGSTIFVGLDHFPQGLLLWRAILQMLGGIGTVVMAITILPWLHIGGMQLFRVESSDQSDKVISRAGQLAISITGVFLLLSLLCAALLWIAGMTPFDAICHALSTLSTGGFSTHDASIGYYHSQSIEAIITLFMIGGAIPFVLYIQAVHGRPFCIFKDSQVRWLLGIIVASTVVMAWWIHHSLLFSPSSAIRQAVFQIVSIVTTTGFHTTDYNTWGNFAIMLCFMLTVFGGCTGSTAGGIKIFRYQVLYQVAKSQLSHLTHPHGIFRPRFNQKPVTDPVINSVLNFFILFAACFLVLTIALSLTKVDFVTSMSAVVTTMANVGPGLGSIIGPHGSFVSLPDTAKWILSLAMLLGRLEIFTVLILLFPQFWRE